MSRPAPRTVFTLIELLVVIAIIAILAAMAALCMGVFTDALTGKAASDERLQAFKVYLVGVRHGVLPPSH